MFSSTLKQKMEGLVAARQIEVKDFNKEHGKTVLGEVTVGQVIGGMRGLPAMLYETSNNIEIHLEDKPVCFGWNSGAGIMGLNNFDGTSAVVPTGYNYPNQWSVFNTNPEGHLFECNCDPASCLIILSTELNQFTATRQDKANLIRWQSGSDHELNHFVLEKSTNGYSFFPIQTIEPKGNPSVNDYQYLDEEIAAGTVYYRLRMVDHQNKINYSSIVAINRTFESSQTIVYPNPALNRFNIQSAQASTIEAVVLYDNAGKQFQLPFSVKNNQLVAVEAANVPQKMGPRDDHKEGRW